MALWKSIDFDTGEDMLFCCRQCAENWVCVNELPEDDLDELNPDNAEDKEFIEEHTPAKCDSCEHRITEDKEK